MKIEEFVNGAEAPTLSIMTMDMTTDSLIGDIRHHLGLCKRAPYGEYNLNTEEIRETLESARAALRGRTLRGDTLDRIVSLLGYVLGDRTAYTYSRNRELREKFGPVQEAERHVC